MWTTSIDKCRNMHAVRLWTDFLLFMQPHVAYLFTYLLWTPYKWHIRAYRNMTNDNKITENKNKQYKL